VICSHRSHCAFINYTTRAGAEAAAEHCQGKAVIQGCPLRVRWGKPKVLDSMDTDVRMMHAREGRSLGKSMGTLGGKQAIEGAPDVRDESDLDVIAPPPGQDNVDYPSLAGN
jgi:pre-mRNA-splicing factor RBM22/SLT11